VARSAETKVERLQCYVGIDEERAIGKFDEAPQRLFLEASSTRTLGSHWDSIRQYFLAGVARKVTGLSPGRCSTKFIDLFELTMGERVHRVNHDGSRPRPRVCPLSDNTALTMGMKKRRRFVR